MCSVGSSGSASEPLCLPPADICIDVLIVAAPTALTLQHHEAGMGFPLRKGGDTECRSSPQLSDTMSGAGLGLAGPSPLPQVGGMSFAFSWLFDHSLSPTLPPLRFDLQPSRNHPALIHAAEGLLSLGDGGARGQMKTISCNLQLDREVAVL